MDFREYQQAAARTSGPKHERTPLRVSVSALGLAGEAGEVVDLLKKVVGHSHPLDKDKLTEELGDLLWYLSDIATLHEIDLQAVARRNIKKLKIRYPEGFTSSASINRAPDVERVAVQELPLSTGGDE